MSSHVDAATLRPASTACSRVPHAQRAGRTASARTTEAGSIDERGDPRLHARRLRRRRARPPDPRRRRPRRGDRGTPHLRRVGAVVGPQRADRPRPRTRVSHHARRFRRITRGWRRHNRRCGNRADARAGDEGRRQQRRHRDGRRPDRPSVSPRRAHRRALDAGGWLRDLAPRLALAWMRRCCSSAIATAQPLVLFDGGRWRERARLPFSG
jgi:hypothetical protein